MVGLIMNWIARIDDWFYYKFKKDNSEVLKMIINKELKPYGVDYDYVREHPVIEDEEWWRHYTFKSEKDYLKWKKYSINVIRRHLTRDKRRARQEFVWIDLCYGLRHDYRKMTEERYQYLKSLPLDQYDKETSAKEQDEYCEIAAERGESEYFQSHNPD